MNTILAILQGLLLDLSGTYTEAQLKLFICIAGIKVNQDIPFDTLPTIDVSGLTFTPDPTDNNYCLFVSMQAGILIVQSELKTASTNSIRIVDGPATIDLAQYYKSLGDYLKLLREDYDKAKLDYLLSGNVDTSGYAITTPTTYLNNPTMFE